MANQHPLQDLPSGSSVSTQTGALCNHYTNLCSIIFPHKTSMMKKHSHSSAHSNKNISATASLMVKDHLLLIHLQSHMVLAHSLWTLIVLTSEARKRMAVSKKTFLMVHQVGQALRTPEQKRAPPRLGGRDRHQAAAI
jgi:hypothetical protein